MITATIAVAVIVGGCSSDEPPPAAVDEEQVGFAVEVERPDVDIASTLTIVYNSPDALALGPVRMIAKAVTDDGAEYGGPDTPMTLVLRQGETETEVPTRWIWSQEGYAGFYVANAVLDRSGAWTAHLVSDDGESSPFPIQVADISIVPAVGRPAIASDSKVLGDGVEFDDLTTDPDPDPDLYRMTVADAITSGKPSVLVFATPMLCRTAVCGPVLDEMKDIAIAYPDVEFVHVEIYEPVDYDDPELIPVDAVVEWQLPSEPWIFVVDDEGLVAASFEGYVDGPEVAAILDDLG